MTAFACDDSFCLMRSALLFILRFGLDGEQVGMIAKHGFINCTCMAFETEYAPCCMI